jgi:hypothetical protein
MSRKTPTVEHVRKMKEQENLVINNEMQGSETIKPSDE